MADYYEFVAQWLLPHIEERPLSLRALPDGWTGQCFYQKHADRCRERRRERIEVPGERRHRDVHGREHREGARRPWCSGA